MGRPKLLLPWKGKAIVRWSVEAIVPHVDRVVVVTGPDDAGVRDALAGITVEFAVNPKPHEGQGTSIAVGIRALPPWTRAALIVLGDQPQVPGDVVPGLLAAWRTSGRSIVAPLYRGVPGTPVLFSADVFTELTALGGDAGARAVVQARPERVERVPFDVAMPSDVDTPEDYARLHVE
ncbi:MAG: nucleotidyltransferase family protein [Candidatus Rokubacteria bacterium]|nr:nucleotidyltransferase family protein [Candidatus Rokubacteria bacterium]